MPKASRATEEEEIAPQHKRSEGAGGQIIPGDNLPVLRKLPHAFARMIYIDPPFNTGRTQRRRLAGTSVLTNSNRLTSSRKCHQSNTRLRCE